MRTIGLNHDMHISSAALIEDGTVIAAAAEERFTREKRTRKFPARAMDYCLNEAGCAITDIDHFVAAWNPGAYLVNFNSVLSNNRRHMAEHLYAVPDHLMAAFPSDLRACDHVEQVLHLKGTECRVHFVTHHRAHAANALFLSPFEETAILTADSQGETEAMTFCVGRGTDIRVLRTISYPQSIGAFYATLTEYLGFRPNSDEWKVMALAAFDEGKDDGYYRIMRDEVVRLINDGEYEFDLTFFNGFNPNLPHLYTTKMTDRFGPPRRPDEPVEDRHYALAAAMQRTTEDVVFHALKWLHQTTGMDTLAVSGGLFMNSVLNGKLERGSAFKRAFISSAPDDSGNAVGAALYLQHAVMGLPRAQPPVDNYWGPSFDDDAILATLNRFGLAARPSDDVEAETALMLADGLIVGWVQGRMEFGQRALGNRSILADPRDLSMKHKVNAAIKFREGFRPFAPAVPIGVAHEWFDLGSIEAVRHMEKVVAVRPEHRNRIPAVVHVDGSARLQTVDQKTAPRFHRLLELFGQRTGVPVIMNTSFNLNGEPIVCTPEDAIRTFFSCGLDALVLGDRILRKSDLNPDQ